MKNSARTSRIENSTIAEWLALEAEKVEGRFLQRALRRASRAAFLWPEEAWDLVQGGGSLLELPMVGPFISKLILRWFEKPPSMTEVPPLRRNFLTLAQARGILQHSGIGSFKGDLQMHSTWSDGSGSIAEMAQSGQERGYKYIAITDHSKGLKIAGGIDEVELAEQGKEIGRVNTDLAGGSVQVLHGIELNLSPNGAGDMESEALQKLDVVVGSFHSRLRVAGGQTERFLAALRNPDIQILGHPRGRIYNFRAGLSADWGRVCACAAKLHKAMELDAYPDRQDLDIELLKVARDSGAWLAIDTDAHHPEQLAFVELGLAAAALAKFPRNRILNFLSRDALQAWISEAKRAS